MISEVQSSGPANDGSAPERASAQPALTAKDLPYRPLIVVVDDDVVTTAIIEAALAQIGFRVRTAHDACTGLAAIREHPPDLILLDVSLPDGNGIDICRQLQGEPGIGQIPVIFISGHDAPAVKVAGFDAGGVDYITKPLAMREVIARVRTHIRLKRGYEALVELQAQRIHRLVAAQESIMPRPEDVPGACFQVAFIQALQAGGDFYDVIPVGENIFDYVVADASGHDLGASVWTAALKALLSEYGSSIHSPVEVVRLLNSALLRILPAGIFFTLIYARLNRASGKLQMVNAAHPPAIVLRNHTDQPEVVYAAGDVVGAFADPVFDCQESTLAKGDRLLLYTDGLTDTPEVSTGGLDRLLAMAAHWKGLPLEEAVRGTVLGLVATGRGEDDVLLMGIEI